MLFLFFFHTKRVGWVGFEKYGKFHTFLFFIFEGFPNWDIFKNTYLEVFKLFTDLECTSESEKFEIKQHPIPVPGPYLVSPDIGPPGSITSDYEFYPADPITRGLDQRMHRLQLRHHNQLCEGRSIDYSLVSSV